LQVRWLDEDQSKSPNGAHAVDVDPVLRGSLQLRSSQRAIQATVALACHRTVG
jgi:hypothetical protein